MNFIPYLYSFIDCLGPEMAMRMITQAQSVSSVSSEVRKCHSSIAVLDAAVTNRLESS